MELLNDEINLNKDLTPNDTIFNYTASDYIDSDKTVRVYYHDIEEMGEIIPHTHDFYELNVVIEGNGRHFIGDYGYFIGGGEVFVIPPKTVHSYEFSGTAKIFHILLSDKFFDVYGDILRNADGYNMLFKIDPKLRLNNRGDAILTLNGEKRRMVYFLINSLFMPRLPAGAKQAEEIDVLKLLVTLSTETAADDKEEGVLALSGAVKALDYITKNFGEKITLKDLSEISDLSRSAFIISFKKLTGQPPLSYLAEYRLERASKMLKDGNKKITDIAMECGFFDNAHFTKEFKKKYGVSPKIYKENAENK